MSFLLFFSRIETNIARTHLLPYPYRVAKSNGADEPDNLAAKPFFLRIISSTTTPLSPFCTNPSLLPSFYFLRTMLATPPLLRPLHSFHLPRSAFSPPFLLFLDALVVWHPWSLQWQTASRGWRSPDESQERIYSYTGRGKIRSPCKTISTIETFVTGYGSLILGTRLISERSETKLWMELTFAAQRSRVDLVQRRKVYIYLFSPFFVWIRVN